MALPTGSTEIMLHWGIGCSWRSGTGCSDVTSHWELVSTGCSGITGGTKNAPATGCSEMTVHTGGTKSGAGFSDAFPEWLLGKLGRIEVDGVGGAE